MSAPDPVTVFRTEAAEVLEQIEAGLLDLANHLSDKALVDTVFRGLHTLKGSGAMFGFDQLAAFTHHCESAFDRVRKGEVPATAELIAAVLAARDHMHALVDTPNGDHEDMGRHLLAQLRAAMDGKSAVSAAVVVEESP
jgi:two-component system chemotaxis sensor kinase CheA